MAQTSVHNPQIGNSEQTTAILHSSVQEPARVSVKLPQLRSGLIATSSKPLPTSLQSDFIPDDVLFSLTQQPVPWEKLGPPSLVRNSDSNMSCSKSPAANVWNHKRRDKFKHLLHTTVCSCGSGKRDISFLYDVPQEMLHPGKPDTGDQSSLRRDAEVLPKKALQIPDTLVPDEFHIVKSKGVMGIEYHEDKYTTVTEDHEKHLVVFPSMKPSSRFEVMQLKKTMKGMLEKVGFNDTEVEAAGPTQMHNLLELVKKEQNIYNIVFHEIIRQTSIECAERGELLSDLRNKYSELLCKVPQQIMGLYAEVMAQRALDRRLTEELMRFKTTISILTDELAEVKEHDKILSREAQRVQEDLHKALMEAQKNAALLAEYHDLYELQRKRLEHQSLMLSEERDIWSTAAYCLALKVTEENKLTIAKRLHVSEKAWSKLANHFTVLLSDRDTDYLTHIQGHVDIWRDQIEDFNMALRQREENMKDSLKLLKCGVDKWVIDFRNNYLNKELDHVVKVPNVDKMRELKADMNAWDKALLKEAEIFGGDLLLNCQGDIILIRKEMEGWTDKALKVFGQHSSSNESIHPDKCIMLEINQEVEHLLEQYQHRLTGENGVASIIIRLQTLIEAWNSRLSAAVNGFANIFESDWLSFYQSLQDWIMCLNQAHMYVGSTQSEEARHEGKPHVSIEIQDMVKKVQKWVTTFSNSIDSEDARLVHQVSTLHSQMVLWMVQTLLRVAPNKEGNSNEAAEMSLLGSLSLAQLQDNAKSLFTSLSAFSNYVTLCCDGIVAENTQQRQEQMEENADHELRDLQRLRMECQEWINTAQILISLLTGESISNLFPSQSESGQPHLKAGSGAEIVEKVEQSMQPISHHSTGIQADKSPIPIMASDVSEPNVHIKDGIKKEFEPDVKLMKIEEQVLEILGQDQNIYTTNLDSATDFQERVSSPSTTAGSPDTRQALQALTAVNTLQQQLLLTEQRAQVAEERAASAEAKVAELKEQLRALQKEVVQPTQSDPSSSTSLATTSQTSLPSHKGASVISEVQEGKKKAKASGKIKKK